MRQSANTHTLMASILSAAPEAANPDEAPSPQARAASAICRTFAPESVYDASFDGGALASALADAAVDVTQHPEPSDGPFGMATALGVPADSQAALALLVHEFGKRTDLVLIALDWRDTRPLARTAAAWLTAFAGEGLHLDPLMPDETAFPGGLLFKRDAAPLPPRVGRAFAQIVADRDAAHRARVALANLQRMYGREAARAVQLENDNRVLRSRLDSLERENRSLESALHDVNGVLAHELEAVQLAEKAVADDITALQQSGLWQLKLRLAGIRKRTRPG